MDAPRDDLLRSVNFELIRADGDGDGRTLEGYAAVFGSRTRINSWEGDFDEVIAPGAFRKTLRERTPVLMFDHGQHPLIGSMPLGAIEKVREDDKGVYVLARLSDNWLIQPVRDAIAEGSITGMSFRFSVVREQWDESTKPRPLRTLLEVKAPELGPVVFPAYRDTSVGVRAADIARHLGDPDFRADLARVLLGTATDAAGTAGTSEVAATTDEPASGHSRTREQRMAAARLIGVMK